jgi:hypothetical protein
MQKVLALGVLVLAVVLASAGGCGGGDSSRVAACMALAKCPGTVPHDCATSCDAIQKLIDAKRLAAVRAL